MNETHHLMETRKNLERALNETEGPMRITSENIYNREGRYVVSFSIKMRCLAARTRDSGSLGSLGRSLTLAENIKLRAGNSFQERDRFG